MAMMHDEEGLPYGGNAVAQTNYPHDIFGTTDHNVESHSGDCFCEPKVLLNQPSFQNLPGPVTVVIHQPVAKPYYPVYDPVTKLFRSLQEPPKEGWDVIMAREQVNALIKDVIIKAPSTARTILRQNPGESVEAFTLRIAAHLERLPLTEKVHEIANLSRTLKSMADADGLEVEIEHSDDDDLDDEDEFELEIDDYDLDEEE